MGATINDLVEVFHTGCIPTSITQPVNKPRPAPAASTTAAAARGKGASQAVVPRPAPTTQVPASFDEEEEDRRLQALMEKFEDLQHEVNEAGSSELQPEIMATIGALVKEKNDLKAQLERKQADLEIERSNLHARANECMQ